MALQLNPQFLVFLEKFPEVFGQLLGIANEWYKLQGEIPATPPAAGPDEFEIGGTTPLETTGISPEEIDAITKSYAEAAKKEEAVAYIQGFLAGVMLKA